MSKAILMNADNGQILVETDDAIPMPTVSIAPTESHRRRPEGAEAVVSIKDLKNDLASVKETIIACCRVLHGAVSQIPKPEKFAVEFSIKLTGEAGIPMLTKASEEANFKITIEWKS